MPRPTPARILYLLIGLLLGLVVVIAAQTFLIPSLVASLPFLSSPPPPVVVTGPTQFGGATLEQVIALNLSHEANEVVVRLNTLERYQDGFTFTYAVMSSRPGVSPSTLEPDTFVVTDNRGTLYTLSPLGTGTVPSAGLTYGFATFTPAPPEDVQAVTVTIPNLLALGLRLQEGVSRVIPGPWVFQMAVRV